MLQTQSGAGADQLETHVALFQFYRDQKKDAPAEKAARNPPEHFPEHVPTLSALADMRLARKKYADADLLPASASKANPLDRPLRARLGLAHQHQARALAEADDFDAARTAYQAALAFEEGKQRSNLLVKWAAVEFKAGNAGAGRGTIAPGRAGATARRDLPDGRRGQPFRSCRDR